MKERLLLMLIQALLAFVTEDILKNFAAMAIKFFRNFILGTKTTIDDKLFLPLLDKIQDAFGIPEEELPEIE